MPARERPSAGSLRKTLISGIALAFVASLALPAEAAPRSKIKSKQAASAKKRDVPIKDPFGDMPKGPLQLVVSIADQRVTLYSNGTRVAQGPVSTGMAGYPTPNGVFSILQKNRHHRSNIYSNAPMPYMQRLTWSGVALHEGVLPGYPASHGCIRMTRDFASRLWVVTKLGVRIVVARNDVVPYEFDHPKLLVPKQKPAQPPVAEIEPEKRAAATLPIQYAWATPMKGSGTISDAPPEAMLRKSVTDVPPAVTPPVVEPVDSIEPVPAPVIPAEQPKESGTATVRPHCGQTKYGVAVVAPGSDPSASSISRTWSSSAPIA